MSSHELKYCVAKRLRLTDLAKLRLPDRSLTQNEVFRQFFSTENRFLDAVAALELAGRLTPRPDHTYRIWDVYRILHLLAQMTTCKVEKFAGRPTYVPTVVADPQLDDAWWDPPVSLAEGYHAAARFDGVEESPDTGRVRVLTDAEREARREKIWAEVLAEQTVLVTLLPDDPEYWRTHLQAHASSVLRFRRSGCMPLARLSAHHLSAAVILAEERLGVSRHELRTLVGTVNENLRSPALIAASFSRPTRAFDLALDAIGETLKDYNSAVAVPSLHLTLVDAEALLRFMQKSGLSSWYTELVIENWGENVLWEMDSDQRTAIVYGRVRSLCALLEEAILAFAWSVNDKSFASAIEGKASLGGRLKTFLKAPAGKTSIVDAGTVLDLAEQHSISPPISPKSIRDSLTALRMESGRTAPPPGPNAEQTLAGLVVVRNMTAHRHRLLLPKAEPAWFKVWGECLPAVNRTVLWSALTLWAITRSYT